MELVMNIKKLNEELKQALNELEIDPSFKDYVNNRREEQREPFKHTMDRLQVNERKLRNFSSKMNFRLCKNIIKQTMDENNATLINIECVEYRIHILFETKPITNITKLINVVKGRSSRLLRKEFSEQLKDKLWGEHLLVA